MPTAPETAWINGIFQPLSQTTVSVEDRGYLFADGIYDVIAANDGVPILLDDHLDRWERSAEGLRLPQAYSRAERVAVIRELLDRLGAPRAMLYGQLTRGTARRTHQFPAEVRPSEMWFARELKPYPAEWFTGGVAALSHPDERWARCWIKSTCLLPNCLAKQYAMERGAFEVIMYNGDGIVTESSASNCFCVKDGAIHTHPTNGRILPGVKRGFTLALARAAGIPVVEQPFTLEFMKAADEIFLTSTTINVLPVTSLDGIAVADGQVGPVVGRLMQLVNSEVQRQTHEGTERIAKAS